MTGTQGKSLEEAMKEQENAILQCANLLSEAESELSRHPDTDAELLEEIREARRRRSNADNAVIEAIRRASR